MDYVSTLALIALAGFFLYKFLQQLIIAPPKKKKKSTLLQYEIIEFNPAQSARETSEWGIVSYEDMWSEDLHNKLQPDEYEGLFTTLYDESSVDALRSDIQSILDSNQKWYEARKINETRLSELPDIVKESGINIGDNLFQENLNDE